MNKEQAIEAMARAFAKSDANPASGMEDLWHMPGYREACIRHATAAHDALTANGMAIVPVEPSEAMIEAGEIEIEGRQAVGMRIYASDVWDIMVAASQDKQP